MHIRSSWLRTLRSPNYIADADGLIDFTAERQRHTRFVGREDVLVRLDEWLDTPGETGWIRPAAWPVVPEPGWWCGSVVNQFVCCAADNCH